MQEKINLNWSCFPNCKAYFKGYPMKLLICQSCGLPFSGEAKGTNRDHTQNEDYCIQCFRNGEFTDHSLTLHELERRLLDMAEVHNEISLEEALEIIRILPDLKRWKMSNRF